MAVFIIILGIASFIYGLLSVLGHVKENPSKDSDMDKKLFSEKTRYFIGRYYAGFQFIIVGLGTIIFGLIIYLN